MVGIAAQLDDVPAVTAPVSLPVDDLTGNVQLAAELHIGQGHALAVGLAQDQRGVDVVLPALGVAAVFQQIFAGGQGAQGGVGGGLLLPGEGRQRLQRLPALRQLLRAHAVVEVDLVQALHPGAAEHVDGDPGLPRLRDGVVPVDAAGQTLHVLGAEGASPDEHHQAAVAPLDGLPQLGLQAVCELQADDAVPIRLGVADGEAHLVVIHQLAHVVGDGLHAVGKERVPGAHLPAHGGQIRVDVPRVGRVENHADVLRPRVQLLHQHLPQLVHVPDADAVLPACRLLHGRLVVGDGDVFLIEEIAAAGEQQGAAGQQQRRQTAFHGNHLTSAMFSKPLPKTFLASVMMTKAFSSRSRMVRRSSGIWLRLMTQRITCFCLRE